MPMVKIMLVILLYRLRQAELSILDDQVKALAVYA